MWIRVRTWRDTASTTAGWQWPRTFTASPAHNSFDATVAAVLRSDALLQLYEQGVRPERLMWTDKAPFSVPASASVSPGRIARLNRKPAILPANGWPPGTTFPADKPPDGRWRLTLLRDQRPDGDLPEALRQPPLLAPEFDQNNPLPGYAAVAGRHAIAAMTHFDHLRQMVFTCNIGLISFFLDGSNVLGVRQTLLSRKGPEQPEASEGSPNTVHDLLLAPTLDQPPVLAP